MIAPGILPQKKILDGPIDCTRCRIQTLCDVMELCTLVQMYTDDSSRLTTFVSIFEHPRFIGG